MLKIKVSIYLSATTGIVTHMIVIPSCQGMSEAKVEKIKVKHFVAYMRTYTAHTSCPQEAAHKIIVGTIPPFAIWVS